MSTRMLCLASLLPVFSSFSTTVTATAIVSVSGNVEEVSAPADVTVGQYESRNIRIFAEEHHTLAANQPVEHQGPGSDPVLNPGSILAGTSLRTYYVHFDPPGTALESANGSVVFDNDILGLILLSGNDGPLEQSHATYGAQGTTYPDDGQGFNNFQTEDFTVSNDLRTLTLGVFADAGIDAMRVFVNVPEPSALVTLLVGIASLGIRRQASLR